MHYASTRLYSRWETIAQVRRQSSSARLEITSKVGCNVKDPDRSRAQYKYTGKVVTRLEYQAYSKLAIKTMADIIRTVHRDASQSCSSHHPEQSTVSSLIRTAVYHRLGTVPVGEPSIVIAVSSPHRKEAFAACEAILEEVKQKVQIWKREFYEGEREEDAEWKANK